MTPIQKQEIDDGLKEVECYLLASAQACLIQRSTLREALGSAVAAGASETLIGSWIREAMSGLQDNCNSSLEVAVLVQNARLTLSVEPTSNDTPNEDAP